MALSQGATDVLAALPFASKCYVDIDTDDYLSIDLPQDATVPLSVIARMKSAWGKKSCRVSVDLVHAKIHLKISDKPVRTRACKCELPTPSDPSEEMAVHFARTLGVIDVDELVPQYELTACDRGTMLAISGVLHIIHDRLQEHADQQACTPYYNMADGCVLVVFPRANKRKRAETSG